MPRGGNKFELLKEQKGVQGKVEPGGVGGPRKEEVARETGRARN